MNSSQKLSFLLGFLDLFAIAIIIPQIAINFRSKGYSPIVYGLTGTTYGTLQTLTGPLFGGYSDIYGRRTFILLAFYCSAVVYLWLGFIESIIPFFIARALLGVFKHSQTMTKSYICDVTPKKDHADVLGRFNAVSSAGFIVGPLVGGYLGSFQLGCVTVSFIFLFSGLLAQLFLLENEQHYKEVSDASTKPDSILTLFRSVDWSQHWDLFTGRLLLALAVVLYRSNLSYVLISSYSLDPAQIGYIISMQGLMAALSGFLVGPIFTRFNQDSLGLLIVSGLVLSSSLLLLCLSSSLSSILCLLLLFTTSSSFARVYGLDAMLRRGTGDDVGLLQGVSQSVASISRGGAPLMAGLLQQIHLELPAIFSGFLALFGSLILIYARKSSHRIQKSR